MAANNAQETAQNWVVDIHSIRSKDNPNVQFASPKVYVASSDSEEEDTAAHDNLAEAIESLPSRRLSAEANVRKPSVAFRRMSRKLVGTVRRKQYQHEHSLLNQIYNNEADDGVDDDSPDTLDANRAGNLASERAHSADELRSMTALSLGQKKAVLQQMKEKRSALNHEQNGETLKRLKTGLDSQVRLARNQISNVLYTIGFWVGHLKTLQGHFGTDVTAYFGFLRLLFLANLFIGVVVLSFIFVPQLVYRFAKKSFGKSAYGSSFSGLELLTGKGWFEDTEMYYGYYSGITLQLDVPYNMPLAYLLTLLAYVFLFFLYMAINTAKSYRVNFIESSSEFRFYYVTKVLAGWDSGILDNSAAKERKKSLLRELQEYVGSLRMAADAKPFLAVTKTALFRVFFAILQLASIAGFGYLTYHFLAEDPLNDQAKDKFLSDIAISLLITCVNGIGPFLFSAASYLQGFEKEQSSILSTLFMTCLLYGSTLGVLITSAQLPHWPSGSPTAMNKSMECWETQLGQQFYQLAVFDMIFTILMMVFVEGTRRLLSKAFSRWFHEPQFDVARNTQNLVYSQVLCWLGVYYCPMLTVVTVIKLFLLFYLKRYFIMITCIPNTKHWKGAQMQTWFLIILFVFFVLCAVAFAVTISSIQPSANCGPFTNINSTFDMIFGPNSVALDIIVSPGTMVVVIVTLCVAVHYTRVVSSGKKELVRLLREQITLECKDKVFLQRLLDQIQKAKVNRRRSRQRSRLLSRQSAEAGQSLPLQQPAGDVVATARPESTPLRDTRRVFAKVRNTRCEEADLFVDAAT